MPCAGASLSGIQVFLELLAGLGARRIFGNPGTTELPLNDALAVDPRFEYVLGLQEVPVMAMADGYALASRSLGVVNLHTCCGLGHAMGVLYNAHREGSPLLVTAGQQDRRLRFSEPILAGDMVSVARPWTKWAHEVTRAADLPAAVRRAAQTALTPPTGPVFLSLPVDVQLETSDQWDLSPIRLPDLRVRPPREAVARAAETLLSAQNPVILAGSRVVEQDGMTDLVALAELLGAPVMAESGTTHGRLAFPTDHPLNAPGLPLWAPEIHERLREHDVALAVGLDVFRLYVYFEPARALPEHVRLVHLDEDAWQLGKNFPTEVALWGHLQAGLADLVAELRQRAPPRFAAAAQTRTAAHAAAGAQRQARLRGQIAEQADVRPLTPLALMAAIADVLPPDAAVVEEAVTTTNTTLERLGALKNVTGYFGHRGWALGWGLGLSIGVKLAWPDRPVLALLGEGAAMYGVQGLWSAARYRVPVVFVICNNAQYQILKVGAQGMGLPHAADPRVPGLDLISPEIDFVGLARALGVEAHRVTEPDELRQRLRAAFDRRAPILFDVPISRATPGRLNYG